MNDQSTDSSSSVTGAPSLFAEAAVKEGDVVAPSSRIAVIEGVLYFAISALPPVAQLLLSDQTITTRSMSGTILAGLIAGAISLKAFFSQSLSRNKIQ